MPPSLARGAHTHAHTQMHTHSSTEPGGGGTHSDLMRLVESLSWSGACWEEGYGVLSLRTVQMLSGTQTRLLWSDQGSRDPRERPERPPKPTHSHRRTGRLFGQVGCEEEGGPRAVRG